MKRSRLLWTLVLLAFLVPASAHARKNSKRLTYPMGDIWSAAVRLLVADLGYTLKSKDKESGYILFIYPGSGKGKPKEYGGSMEFVSFVDPEGYRMVRVQLNIAGQPSYIMVQLLDKLEQKLRDEQGPPPEAVKVKEKKKSGSKDKDKDKEEKSK